MNNDAMTKEGPITKNPRAALMKLIAGLRE